MSKATAKAKITAVFKTNGSQGITGANSQSALTGMLDDVYADLAEKVATPTNGDLIKTDANGNPVDSGITATSVSTHLANTSNPHSVTKAQVGLGNCDNTSDADKPISTATQSALDDKADADDVESALADKADIDGSYPLMEVGSAINISGSDKVSAEVLFRTSGGTANIGSGTAKIDKYFGNSYAWNQLVQNGNFENTDKWGIGGATLSASNNILTITANTGIQPYASLVNNNDGTMSPIAGHVYLTMCSLYPTISGDVSLGLFGSVSSHSVVANTWNYLANIKVYTDNATKRVNIAGVGSLIPNAGDVVKVKDIQLFDLTLIFGAGYEPASVSALKATEIGAYICSGYHAYNAGGLLSFTGTGIKTVGFNAYDNTTQKAKVIGGVTGGYQITGTYTSISQNGVAITPNGNGIFYPATGYIDVVGGNSTTCINLVHSGRRNGEYEPYWASTLSFPITTATGKLNGAGSSIIPFADGFKSAGTARDEAWNEMVNGVNTGKARKRSVKINLGDCTWTATSSNRFYTTIVGVKKSKNVSSIANVLCAKYTATTPTDIYTTDKCICIDESDPRCTIRDTAYSDAASFKAAMNGVYLIYELATPEEYVMDAPWSTNYRVDDWGTEEIVPSQGSAPTSAPAYYSVEYALNAKDDLRNLGRNYMSCNPSESGNTLTAITSALLSKYGINITLTWDSANSKYNVTTSGGWEPVASAPASASASGTKGQYYIDTNYLYICIASNTWKRVAIATW